MGPNDGLLASGDDNERAPGVVYIGVNAVVPIYSGDTVPKILWSPVRATRLVHHRAGRRSDALDRHVFRKVGKSIDKFLETNLLFDSSLAELWQEAVPIGVPCVKLSQFVA